jgi:iron complex transport system ATP-binding protein
MEPINATGINLKNLTIGYRKGNNNLAIGGLLNANAKPGQLIALIGPNGVGKSTLIRTICQLQPSLSGQILINDLDLKTLARNEIAKNISLVSTDLYRTSKLKVSDLVELGRFPHGSWFSGITAVDKQIIQNSMVQVNMDSLSSRDITELSDGEYQRTMIARALAQDTQIVLLDEPTAFLDLANKFSIVSLLWNLTRTNQKTIVFSTHDINIALQYADVFWILTDKGLHVGAPEDLILDGTLENLYSGSGVFFDSDTSQFRNKKTKSVPIKVEGEGSELQLTKMALDRLGFDTNCNNTATLSVHVSKTMRTMIWKFSNRDQMAEYTSINELQKELRNYLD